MHVERMSIQDVLLLKPLKHGDERGFFSETYRGDTLEAYGVSTPFVQDNHVRSTRKGILRGLHFQNPPRAQGKLVRCARGSILDVAVDIRTGSPTFGQHVKAELSAENWSQLWVPPGFAHGYLTLTDECEVHYKVTDYYAPDFDSGIAWNDPALGIDWGISDAEVVLSNKDKRLSALREISSPFQYAG